MAEGLRFKIGAAVRRMRREADLTLEVLSERTAIPSTRLAAIEEGRAATSLDELFALKSALKVSVKELLRELREEKD